MRTINKLSSTQTQLKMKVLIAQLCPSLCNPIDYSPGEDNGTHSSALAWKIPWTEEPGGLQSMGSLRVGHD